MTERLDMVVLADIHYVGPGGAEPSSPKRKAKLGLELAVRAVRDALRSGPTRPDLIALMGDMVDLGTAPGAIDDMIALRDALAKFEIPIIAVPGNHDRLPEKVAEIFASPPGLHQFAGYSLVSFADRYADDEVCTRPEGQMAALDAAAGAGRPIVVLQHNPLLPRINASYNYPYTISDAEALAGRYADAGVTLSLSGHFHAGQPPFVYRGVTFITCPVLCQTPFRYMRVRLAGRRVEHAEVIDLAPPRFAELFDAHLHTEFAYCAEDTFVEGAIERQKLFGLGLIGLCEHADQLYFEREGFWKRPDPHDLTSIQRSVAAGHSRHEAFRRRVFPLKSGRMFIGLEVDPELGGTGLAVLPRDLRGFDYLVGSVHHITRGRDRELSDAEILPAFVRRTEQLLAAGVDILAHPLRYFPNIARRPVPPRLMAPIADLLARYGVAAEINFHNDSPPPEFFAMCAERGVKLSIASDAHSLVDVADLRPHLGLLEQIGVADRLGQVLWRPRQAPPAAPRQ